MHSGIATTQRVVPTLTSRTSQKILQGFAKRNIADRRRASHGPASPETIRARCDFDSDYHRNGAPRPPRLSATNLAWSAYQRSFATSRAEVLHGFSQRLQYLHNRLILRLRGGCAPRCSPKSKAGELITNIARNLVGHPTRVSGEEIARSPGPILRPKVASDKSGNVTGIGRKPKGCCERSWKRSARNSAIVTVWKLSHVMTNRRCSYSLLQ